MECFVKWFDKPGGKTLASWSGSLSCIPLKGEFIAWDYGDEEIPGIVYARIFSISDNRQMCWLKCKKP